MKKLFLSLIVAAVGALGMYAQTDQVATLSHGTNITEYYGADALSKAYEAAEQGDVITLSSGTFTTVNIEKAITIKGAGMMLQNDDNSGQATIISGATTINVPSESTPTITLEGIMFCHSVIIKGNGFSHINLVKCRFDGDTDCSGVDATVIHSLFWGALSAKPANTIIHCQNSVIKRAYPYGSFNNAIGIIIADNCFIGTGENKQDLCSFTNCIISTVGQNHFTLSSTCVAKHCIGLAHYGVNPFELIPDNTNIFVGGDDSYSSIFKYITSYDISVGKGFELTDEAAATYLGNDGTQVGIYGGALPFNPLPSNSLKKFNVNSSTENGKLRVHIDVE